MVPSLDSPLGRHIQGLLVSEAKSMRPGRRTFTGNERTAQFRCILLSWLSAVCEELALCRETWYLAVRLIDEHIAAIAGPAPRPASWQVIGSAALLAAGKTCETVPPGIAEIVAPLAGASGGAAAAASQVRIAELELVQGAHFTILVPTAIDWIKVMCECIAGASSAVHAHYDGFIASSAPSENASDMSVGLQQRFVERAQGTPLPTAPRRRAAASGDEWSVVSVEEEAPGGAHRTFHSPAHALPLSAELYVALLTAPGVRGPDITSRVTAFMPLPPNAAAAAARPGLALESPLFASARVAPGALAAAAVATATRTASSKITESDHNRFRPIRLFSDVMSLIDAATLHVRSFDFAPSILASAAMLVILQSYNDRVVSSLATAGESTAAARARLLLNSDVPTAAMARLFAMHPLVFEIVHLAVIGVVRVQGQAASSDSGAPLELSITTPHSASSRAAAASAAAAAIAADEMAAAESQPQDTGSSGRKRARFRGCGSEPVSSDIRPSRISVSNEEPDDGGGSRSVGFRGGLTNDFEEASVEARCDYRWASLRQCVTWLTLLFRDLPEHVSPASAAHMAALNISPEDVPFLQPCNPLLRAHVRSHLSAYFSGMPEAEEAQEGVAAAFPALFASWRVARSDTVR